MKKTAMVLILSAFAFTLGTLEAAWGSSSRTTTAQNTPTTTGTQNVLYIQTAKEAVIERELGETKGSYILTLKGVQPNLAYFGNTPQRLAGKVDIDSFLNDRTGNTLNGALVTTSTTPSNLSDVSESLLIISEPVYNARTQELKLKVRNASGNGLEIGRHPNPILFIDNN